MASSNNSAMTIFGIIAIVVLAGIAAYFVIERTDDEPDFQMEFDDGEVRLDVDDTSALDVPVTLARAPRAEVGRPGARASSTSSTRF